MHLTTTNQTHVLFGEQKAVRRRLQQGGMPAGANQGHATDTDNGITPGTGEQTLAAATDLPAEGDAKDPKPAPKATEKGAGKSKPAGTSACCVSQCSRSKEFLLRLHILSRQQACLSAGSMRSTSIQPACQVVSLGSDCQWNRSLTVSR